MREHHEDQTLKLPPFFIYCGRVSRAITQTLNIGAITIGRRVWVSPAHVSSDERGGLLVPGWLIVHEATHVLQYERAGYLGFYLSYLGGYWRALRKVEKWDEKGRNAAYLAIPEERLARQAEKAYVEWSARMSAPMNEEADALNSFHLILDKGD